MSTNHNRIKVADLETNQPDKILKTNQNGELEFSDVNNLKIENYNALDCTTEGKTLDARQGKILKDMIDLKPVDLASDTETQITTAVSEDKKVVSRLKLFNWWNWIKKQTVSITGNWNFSVLNITGYTIGATTPKNTIYNSVNYRNSFNTPFSGNWQNVLSFLKSTSINTFETSVDGLSNWTAQTINKKLFANKDSYAVNVINTAVNRGARWTFKLPTSYLNTSWLTIGYEYHSTTMNKSVLVEVSVDGNTWVTKHSSKYNIFQSNVIHFIEEFSNEIYLRLTISCEHNDTGVIPITSISLWTARPRSLEDFTQRRYPYTWDENENFEFNGTAKMKASNTSSPSMQIPNGTLTTTPQNGAIERDNSGKLWTTRNGARYMLTEDDGSYVKILINGGQMILDTHAPYISTNSVQDTLLGTFDVGTLSNSILAKLTMIAAAGDVVNGGGSVPPTTNKFQIVIKFSNALLNSSAWGPGYINELVLIDNINVTGTTSMISGTYAGWDSNVGIFNGYYVFDNLIPSNPKNLNQVSAQIVCRKRIEFADTTNANGNNQAIRAYSTITSTLVERIRM